MFGNEHTPNLQENETSLLLSHIICLSWAGCSSALHCLHSGTQADRVASVCDITISWKRKKTEIANYQLALKASAWKCQILLLSTFH